MRPTVEELIEGMAYTFSNAIVPELSPNASQWARRMSDSLSGLFHHLLVRLEREADLALQENKDLKELLTMLAAHPQAADTLNGVADEFRRQAATEIPLIPDPKAVAAQNVALNGILQDAIEAMEAAAKVSGSDAFVEERRRIRRYLKQQLDRELEVAGATMAPQPAPRRQ